MCVGRDCCLYTEEEIRTPCRRSQIHWAVSHGKLPLSVIRIICRCDGAIASFSKRKKTPSALFSVYWSYFSHVGNSLNLTRQVISAEIWSFSVVRWEILTSLNSFWSLNASVPILSAGTFFIISPIVFYWRNRPYGLRISWQIFHFWVNYPFKSWMLKEPKI